MDIDLERNSRVVVVDRRHRHEPILPGRNRERYMVLPDGSADDIDLYFQRAVRRIRNRKLQDAAAWIGDDPRLSNGNRSDLRLRGGAGAEEAPREPHLGRRIDTGHDGAG